MNVKLLFTGGILLFACAVNAQSFAEKMKQKAAQAAEKALEKKGKEKTGTTTNETQPQGDGSSSTTSGNRPTNKGGGLVSTPPDVNQNLADAESAYKASKYGEARYAVQQAMLGVEMEIGQKVLKSLPEKIGGIEKLEDQDQVTSTGYGWAGLTIVRVYQNDDQEFKTTVANNSAWMSAVNMYMANGGYSQTTGGEQNWKQTKIKGFKAIIEYDENSGYKLSVPLGQSSLIVFEGINYATEKDMMTAAETFDIEGIKKMLGEQ
jgi:hypothetical protein